MGAIRYHRPVVYPPPAATSLASDQWAPLNWRPEWRVAHLVFQGGVPVLKTSSMTGGGFMPVKQFAGRQAPLTQPYVTPLSSIAAGGFVPARPNFLQRLFGGQTRQG